MLRSSAKPFINLFYLGIQETAWSVLSGREYFSLFYALFHADLLLIDNSTLQEQTITSLFNFKLNLRTLPSHFKVTICIYHIIQPNTPVGTITYNVLQVLVLQYNTILLYSALNIIQCYIDHKMQCIKKYIHSS